MFHSKPDSLHIAFHQFMKRLREIFKNNRKVAAGTTDVKIMFVGKEKAKRRYMLKKDSAIKKIGARIAQKMPPAFSKKPVPGIFKTNL